MASTGVLDLTISQPQLAGMNLPDTAWLRTLTTGTYEPAPRGTRSARAAVVRYLAARAEIDPVSLVLTASTSEAYAYLLLALCDPGDAVLVPTPGYPLLDDIAQLLGVRLLRYRLDYDGAWYIDRASLPDRRQIDNDKVRAIVIISPHNPTGHVLCEDEFAALSGLGLPLIVDEVFYPYVFDRSSNDVDPLRASLQVPLLFVLGGLSKSVAAPGLKLSWLVARGSFSPEFLEGLDIVADAFLSVGQFVQDGLGAILDGAPEVQECVLQRTRTNLAWITERLNETAVTPLYPRSGWSMILRLPALVSEEEYVRRLADRGVVVRGGGLFDLPFPSSLVVSLLVNPDVLRAGVEHLLDLVERLQSPLGGTERRR